jgi:RNA polymerase sigma factor (sigma-70 family)
MPQTDAAAVALARDGDSEAFRALVERHSRAVYRLAHRMTGTSQDAEDVVQETFLKAYRQLSRFESRANFSTWLHRIAVNCSIDLIRARPHREAGHDAADLEQFGTDGTQDAGRASPERLMLSTEVQERVNSGRRSCCGISKGGQSTRSASRSDSRRTRRNTASSGRSRKCAWRSNRSCRRIRDPPRRRKPQTYKEAAKRCTRT